MLSPFALSSILPVVLLSLPVTTSTPHLQVRPEGAVVKSAAYVALYDYTAQNETQLNFKHGETVC